MAKTWANGNYNLQKQGRIRGGTIGAIASLKTYESNFIHHYFVQLCKRRLRYEAILRRPLFCHSSVVKYTSSLFP